MPLWGDVHAATLRFESKCGVHSPLAAAMCHASPASPASHPSQIASGSRLGERLRQLRVAAGLTQSELADGRFSKEYISQIERGKTRPTAETLDWLAARLGVDADYLRQRRLVRRPRARRGRARPGRGARRGAPARRGDRASSRTQARRRPPGRAAISSSACSRRGVGADPARRASGGARPARRGPRLAEGAGVLRRRPRRRALPPRRRAATSSRASPPRVGLFDEALSSRSVRSFRATFCAPTSSAGAPAATAASATSRPRARTSSAR